MPGYYFILPIISIGLGIYVLKAILGRAAGLGKIILFVLMAIFFTVVVYLQLIPFIKSGDHLPLIYFIAPGVSAFVFSLVLGSIQRTTLVLFGMLFFLFTIGLTLQFFPVGPNIVTDRYTYVPYIGLFFIIAQGYVWLIDKKEKKFALYKSGATLVLAGFSGWCMFLSYERCDVWTNSETLWTDVIEKFPNTSEGYLNRGQYYTDNDIFDKAMVDYESTLRLNPKSTLAYINRGNVYGRNGVYDKALENYSKAIELTPGASKIYLNRGNVYGLQGDIPASIVDFTKAIQLERNYLDAYINRGISYSKLGDFNSALVDFNMALQINPSSFKTLSMRAYALLDMGNLDAAINDYNRLIQVNPNDGNSYFYRGLAKYRKSNYIEAIKDYSLALQINSANGEAYLNRALAYEAIQDYAKALQDGLAAQQAGQNIAPDFIRRLQAASGN
jgi:tetratricopeptide (TPR) repeat protein